MSNAAVIVNTVLRIRSALLGKRDRQCVAVSCIHSGIEPHVISGKGNGKRH